MLSFSDEGRSNFGLGAGGTGVGVAIIVATGPSFTGSTFEFQTSGVGMLWMGHSYSGPKTPRINVVGVRHCGVKTIQVFDQFLLNDGCVMQHCLIPLQENQLHRQFFLAGYPRCRIDFASDQTEGMPRSLKVSFKTTRTSSLWVLVCCAVSGNTELAPECCIVAGNAEGPASGGRAGLACPKPKIFNMFLYSRSSSINANVLN